MPRLMFLNMATYKATTPLTSYMESLARKHCCGIIFFNIFLLERSSAVQP